MQFECFRVLLHEGFSIGDNEGEVTTTTGTGHLPGEDVVHSTVVGDGLTDVAIVQLGMADIGGSDHTREHGYLGLERGFIGRCKGNKVTTHDGIPAGFGGIGKGLDLGGGDILVLNNGTAGLAGLHRYHHEVILEETESHLVIGALNLFGPEVIVIIVTAEARNANTDRVLGTRNVTVFALGIVLEAEDEAGKHLGIHLGQLYRPYLLDHLAGAGAQTTTVAHIEGGLERYGKGPTGMMSADIGLVNPGAGKV